MNYSLGFNSHCFCATFNSVPCGFIALTYFMHPKVKNMMMINRLVVLPEFQGFGIGSVMATTLAQYFVSLKNRIRIVTSHIAMIKSLQKNKNWKLVRIGRISKPATGLLRDATNSRDRITCSLEYQE